MARLDRTDARILRALCAFPRATGVQLAGLVNMARNTVQARLGRWDTEDLLAPFDRRVDPRDLGYPLRAYIAVVVDQHRLEEVVESLGEIPEVLEVVGISGIADLQLLVVAADADDLYRIAGQVLGVSGVDRTTVSVVMHEAIPYRTLPLIDRLAGSPTTD
ncbi:Lrp/AsnC family transcriptional regulator [Gordonia sp. (in: high G+C Gram-positive bacteria)]|uniref:Lrp/AsnC family transcriptional regulator n=1 Tax=Gordonia sp. (in: high G+C Gram-positive bacteria) TaxID=84139 RepID=UPI0016A5AE39|nr:Lrp/AsnC family transcriptional regulator [Gordonia sp. (in: high G+C Gram-positive bacteria)]NLG47382.1 Lrp/AsnC family transcriptional regulator [Gordonia sp. (in: high G+C Gram-positive bacteria)]